MCGGCHNKHPHTTSADSLRYEPFTSPRRQGMDRARPAPGLTATDLNRVRMHLRATADSDSRAKFVFEVDWSTA